MTINDKIQQYYKDKNFAKISIKQNRIKTKLEKG